MELDSTLCYCFRIKKRKIVNFVKQTRPRRASQIAECFGAGTGCGWCVPFLKRIYENAMARPDNDGTEVDGGDEELTAAEYQGLRETYLQEIKAGTRKRNQHEGELANAQRPTPEAAPTQASSFPDRNQVERDDGAGTKAEDSEWDVSEYFSRPPRPDPEPETLE